MSSKESSSRFNPKESFWRMTSLDRRDLYRIAEAVQYNLPRLSQPQEQWRRAIYTLGRVNILRNQPLNLPVNEVLEQLFDRSYQKINVDPNSLELGTRGGLTHLDKIAQLEGINSQTVVARYHPLYRDYVAVAISADRLPESLAPDRIRKIFISVGFDEQLVNLKRANDWNECLFWNGKENRWEPVCVGGAPVRMGFFHYDPQGREVLCLLRYRELDDEWRFYGRPTNLWLAEGPWGQTEVKTIASLVKQIQHSADRLKSAPAFSRQLTEILLTAKNPESMIKRTREIMRESIMETVRNPTTKNRSRTSQLLEIVDYHQGQSPLALDAINNDCFVRAVLGEQIKTGYNFGSVPALVYWINHEDQTNPIRLSKILHRLGGVESNHKIQALLLKMFALFSLEKIKVPKTSGISQESLRRAGRTTMRILTEKKDDVGWRISPFFEKIRQAAAGDYSGGAGRTFCAEGEIAYQHDRLEWDGAPSDRLEDAFALADAVLEINLALKKDKLLFAMAGDSLHTHVRFPEVVAENPELQTKLKLYFRQLAVNLYLCINPVDRLLAMFQNRWHDLVEFGEIPGGHGFKKQCRLGMSLDRLSHDIAKSEALFSRRIGQLVEHEFTENREVSKGWARLIDTHRSLTAHMIHYLNGTIDKTEDPQNRYCLQRLVSLCEDSSSHRQILRDDAGLPASLIYLLDGRLKRLIVDQKALENKLAALRQRYEKYGDVSYDELNQAKTNLEAARLVPISAFFLAGKKGRDDIGAIVKRVLDSASAQIAEEIR